MNKAVIGGIVALLVIFGGVLMLMRSDSPDTNSVTTSESPQPAATPVPTTEPATEGAVITFDGSSFSPSELTVPAGTTVTITNTSSREIQFDSDPHPAHTDNPELNVGTVEPGQSDTFTVTTTGEHGFHDHLSANITGTLIVE